MIQRCSPVELGREIRRRREASGMSQAELARRAELTAKYIRMIEDGHSEPTVGAIRALSTALHVSPPELFGSEPELSAAAEEMARLYAMANPAVQEAIVMLLLATTKAASTE